MTNSFQTKLEKLHMELEQVKKSIEVAHDKQTKADLFRQKFHLSRAIAKEEQQLQEHIDSAIKKARESQEETTTTEPEPMDFKHFDQRYDRGFTYTDVAGDKVDFFYYPDGTLEIDVEDMGDESEGSSYYVEIRKEDVKALLVMLETIIAKGVE